MEQGEPQTQTTYTEYIPEDIMQAAGIYGEPLAIEQMRFELYELENDVAAKRGELAGMRKKWERIKKSLRFNLIMLVVFFLLRVLMTKLYNEQYMLYGWAADKGADQMEMIIKITGMAIYIFEQLFYRIDWIFLMTSLYRLYDFFSNNDWDVSRRWCEWTKTKNLSLEIEQYELRFIRLEERLRSLKQARTMYRERKQEEWKEENLPERIVIERALSKENADMNSAVCLDKNADVGKGKNAEQIL